MPPKKEDSKKAAKPKTNFAVELHADIDLKKLYETATKLKCPLEPVNPFLKKVKAEIQAIKDGEQFDVPTFPLFLYDHMPFDTCRAFFNVLAGYPWLRHLSLLHCKIGDDGAMVIAEFLRSYAPHPERNPFGIEVLELQENDIGPRGAGYLGRVLTQNETVKVLNLDFNPLGDDGAGLLGDGLKWNCTLETLSMQYCGFGPEGGDMIAKYIVRSSSVKELSLRGNALGPHGVTQIARSLAKNAYLVNLDLADTSFGIDLETIEALRDGLEGNDSLETVDLNFNSMVPAGVQLLLEMLKSKPKLTRFVVYERLSEVVFKDIMDTAALNLKNSKKKKKKGKAASKPTTAGNDGSAPGTGRGLSSAGGDGTQPPPA